MDASVRCDSQQEWSQLAFGLPARCHNTISAQSILCLKLLNGVEEIGVWIGCDSMIRSNVEAVLMKCELKRPYVVWIDVVSRTYLAP
jgi:hypothetical protein